MKEKKKPSTGSQIDWPNQIMNFFGVVIGVLFAFSLNHWNESRKSERQTAIALENIKKEIHNNLENLNSNLPSNMQQKDFLTLFLDNVNDDLEPLIQDEDSLRSIFGEFEAFYVYTPTSFNAKLEFELYALSSVAWETAVQSQLLTELDYELAYVIQEHYSVQEKLTLIDDAIIEEVRKLDNSRAAMERIRTALRIGNDIAETLIDRTTPDVQKQLDDYLSGL